MQKNQRVVRKKRKENEKQKKYKVQVNLQREKGDKKEN